MIMDIRRQPLTTIHRAFENRYWSRNENKQPISNYDHSIINKIVTKMKKNNKNFSIAARTVKTKTPSKLK